MSHEEEEKLLTAVMSYEEEEKWLTAVPVLTLPCLMRRKSGLQLPRNMTSCMWWAGDRWWTIKGGMILTLSTRSGTTLLIIVRLFSNLRCRIVRHLRFLKKTELIYLHYRPFFNWSCILVYFLQKHKTDLRTVKNLKLVFKLFPER